MRTGESELRGILTDSIDYQTARKYWNKLKQRLSEEGNESVTNCHQLKLTSPGDGKKYLTDVADTEQLFRLIQSVPSKKAEPVKQWIARTAAERIDQLMDPELSIKQAMADYKRMGYSDNWINQRLKSIEIRKDLTDEWKKRGLSEGPQFATLTDIIYKAWSDMSAKEYKKFKGLTKENLRDNNNLVKGISERNFIAAHYCEHLLGEMEIHPVQLHTFASVSSTSIHVSPHSLRGHNLLKLTKFHNLLTNQKLFVHLHR